MKENGKISHISRCKIVNTKLVLTVLEKSAKSAERSIIDLFINNSVCSKFATILINLDDGHLN